MENYPTPIISEDPTTEYNPCISKHTYFTLLEDDFYRKLIKRFYALHRLRLQKKCLSEEISQEDHDRIIEEQCCIRRFGPESARSYRLCLPHQDAIKLQGPFQRRYDPQTGRYINSATTPYTQESQIDPYLRKVMDCCLLHQITSYQDPTVFYRYSQGWIREAYDTKGRPIFMIGTRDELLFRSIREAWIQQHVIQLG